MLCVCKGGTVAPSARTGPATCAAKRADVLGSSHLGRVLSWLWIYPNSSLLTKRSPTAPHLLPSIRHSSRLRWRCLGWPLAWSAQIPLVLVPTPLDSLPVRLARTSRAHPHRTLLFSSLRLLAFGPLLGEMVTLVVNRLADPRVGSLTNYGSRLLHVK